MGKKAFVLVALKPVPAFEWLIYSVYFYDLNLSFTTNFVPLTTRFNNESPIYDKDSVITDSHRKSFLKIILQIYTCAVLL